MQWHNKLFIINFLFILILFLIQNVNGIQLGISPEELYFFGKEGEVICKNYSIFTDKMANLYGNDLWLNNNDERKNILKYKNISKELNVSIKIKEKILNNGRKIYPICLEFDNFGEYNGAIIYSNKNGQAGVGIWIKAKIIENKEKYKSLIIGLLLTMSNTLLLSLLIMQKKQKTI
ncbi:MAG: hypothetical protein WC867_07475 [Candidatus Pacearchaeota archaeon]